MTFVTKTGCWKIITTKNRTSLRCQRESERYAAPAVADGIGCQRSRCGLSVIKEEANIESLVDDIVYRWRESECFGTHGGFRYILLQSVIDSDVIPVRQVEAQIDIIFQYYPLAFNLERQLEFGKSVA